MKVRALRAMTMNIDGVSTAFQAGEIKDLEPFEAGGALAQAGWDEALKDFPLKLQGMAPHWPGVCVTWEKDGHLRGPCTILTWFKVQDQEYAAVMYLDRKQAHIIRASEIIEAQPHYLLALLFTVLQNETEEERKHAAKALLIDLLSSVRENEAPVQV